MSTSSSKEVRDGWIARADALAGHALSNLVNRSDLWGGYLPLGCRTETQKSVTKPAKRLRGRRSLNRAVLAAHFAGLAPEHVVGLHAISVEDTCRWGAVDIDRHGETGDPAANWAAAVAWAAALRVMGFDPLVTDSNGDGGFHIHVIFDAPVPAHHVHAMMRRLVRDFGKHGLTQRPETFPKRPSLAPGKCGTWLRLPGLHHSRDHFSRVWDGSEWREGDYAIDLILGSRPDDASLVPEVVPPPAVNNPVAIDNDVEQGEERPRMTEREVALACVDHIDNAGEGLPYDDWVAVGMALHSVDSGASMRDEWERLSRKSSKYTNGVCREKWSSFGNGGDKHFTVGTLVHLARRSGFDPFKTNDTTKHAQPRKGRAS